MDGQRTVADIQRWLRSGVRISEQEIERLEQDGRAGVQKAVLAWRNARLREQEEKQRVDRLWDYERQWIGQGYRLIAGVDEVGRGPLAGPVTACAVILPLGFFLEGINDSKKCSPQKRELLFTQIMEGAVAVSVAHVTPGQIDELNILQASLLAMKQALARLQVQPEVVLVDGNQFIPGLDLPQVPLIGGDGLSISIAAASIIAKVTRDRLMCELDQAYPLYHFAIHKGYPTAEHVAALQRHGASPVHRRSFAPVAAVCERSEP